MSEKIYELRNLTADDMFPMFQILSKIGIREFKGCLESPEIKKEIDLNSVGIAVAMDMAGIILTNLPKAKEDIYQLLSGLSGMSKKEIAGLPMATFTEMVIDVVKKEEFKDFFQAVAKLFKSEN